MKRINQFRKFVKPAVQFLAGFGGIVLIGFLVLQLIPEAKDRAGWQTVRPPQDVMALVLYQNHLWSGGSDGLAVIDLQTGENLPDLVPENKFKGITALLVTASGSDALGGASSGSQPFARKPMADLYPN